VRFLGKGNVYTVLVGMQIHPATIEISVNISQKTKNFKEHMIQVYHSCVYTEGIKVRRKRDTYISMFITALFTKL
jgi:hypothetical protein